MAALFLFALNRFQLFEWISNNKESTKNKQKKKRTHRAPTVDKYEGGERQGV